MPLRRFGWLTTWWRHYRPTQDGAELCVVCVANSAGELVGLLPCYYESTCFGRTLRLLGSGEVCTDYLGLLAAPGSELAVAEAVGDWLASAMRGEGAGAASWDAVELESVATHDPAMESLVACVQRHGALVGREATASCWRIALPREWDAYLATLSRSHRKQIRRCQERYLARGRTVLRQAANPAELARGLDIFHRLHTRRAQSLGRPGCFASPRYSGFIEEVAGELLASGVLRLYWLELDGQAVAVEFQLADGDCVYAYQSGIEPDALVHEPGRLITIATMQQAIAEGRRAFDLLRGDEPYKAHWRARPIDTQTIRLIADSRAARVRYRLWLAQRGVKRWLKANLAGNRTEPDDLRCLTPAESSQP
jgi:CelD/BcsL family acetyltransferase involved in cellulose biosynthesis